MVQLQYLPVGAKWTHLSTWLMYRCISPVGGSEVLVVKTRLPSTLLNSLCFQMGLFCITCSSCLLISLLFLFFSPQLFLLMIFLNLCWNLLSISDVCLYALLFMYTSLLYIMSVHTDEASLSHHLSSLYSPNKDLDQLFLPPNPRIKGSASIITNIQKLFHKLNEASSFHCFIFQFF